ncbi:MAG: O-antigen/teichoic acid export membrane protein [Hyphomicrobiaceae bacterium]
MKSGIAQKLSGSWLGRLASDKLLRNFGLLGLGEGANRITRIVTTIVLARYLGAVEFGIAATAITCFELVRVFAQNGLSQMVVRAPEKELAATCNTAYRLILVICIFMAALQLAAGAVLAWLTGRPELFAMIACLVGVYAVMPSSMVQHWLLQREYRMGTIAGIDAAQVCTDNLLTAGLAICGFGAWAIVLPKLLTAPIFWFGTRRAIKWRYDRSAGGMPLGETIRFCLPILASEILVAVRGNADNMLVGSILGLEALGIYYFAYNAGYGLSSVLTNALAAVSFPHLASAKLAMSKLVERFDHAMLYLALPISAIIALQALAVPYYVPLLFGDKWDSVVLIVSILCLSATTRSCFDLSAQLLRAGGLQNQEFAASTLFTITLLSTFAVALLFGLLTGVTVLCISSVAMQLAFAFWARRRIRIHMASTTSSTEPLAGSHQHSTA